MSASDPTQTPSEASESAQDNDAKHQDLVAVARENKATSEKTLQPALPWSKQARTVSTVTKILGWLIPLAWIVAWVTGTTWQHVDSTGIFSIRPGLSFEVILWALLTGVLIRMLGYVLSLALRLERSAQNLVTQRPRQADEMSEAALEQVFALNTEIDRALSRLAEAESLIRQQVKAIGTASETLGEATNRNAERLERERDALMSLTEEMNQEAERFAEKIAERTQRAADAHTEFEERVARKDQQIREHLDRFENTSSQSFDRFEELARAMEERGAALRTASLEVKEHHESVTGRIDENTERIKAAQDQLAEQTSRLEALMQDQRRRADKLAKAVTEQAGKVLSSPGRDEAAPTGPQGEQRNKSWKDILETVENATPAFSPAAKPAPTPKPSALPLKASSEAKMNEAPQNLDNLDRLVVRIQNFSLVLQTQLFGTPPDEQLERFEGGERQIFARSLAARDHNLVRERIREELEVNPVFRERTNEFLRDFDTILEPISAEDGGADKIQTYLASPLGRLYMMTGSATGHFD